MSFACSPPPSHPLPAASPPATQSSPSAATPPVPPRPPRASRPPLPPAVPTVPSLVVRETADVGGGEPMSLDDLEGHQAIYELIGGASSSGGWGGRKRETAKTAKTGQNKIGLSRSLAETRGHETASPPTTQSSPSLSATLPPIRKTPSPAPEHRTTGSSAGADNDPPPGACRPGRRSASRCRGCRATRSGRWCRKRNLPSMTVSPVRTCLRLAHAWRPAH